MLSGQTNRITHVSKLNRQDVHKFLISSFEFTQIKINLRKKERKREFNYLHGKRTMKARERRGVKNLCFMCETKQSVSRSTSFTLDEVPLTGMRFEEYRVFVNYLY